MNPEQLLQLERVLADGLKAGIIAAEKAHQDLGVELLIRGALRGVVERCFERLPEAEALELLGNAMEKLMKERGR
jgi:hypothetical protein